MSNSKSKNVKIVKTITTTRKSHPGTTTYCRGGYEEDWWEKSPKTDYTYAKSMSYRASHEPECSSPNMSRHPLHHNGAGLQDIHDEDDEVHISTSQTHHQLTTASSLASSYTAAQTEQERTPRIQDKTSSVTLQDHNSFRASSAHKVQSSIQKSSHRSSAMSTLHVPALHYNSFPLPPSPTGSTSSAVVFPPSATRSGAQYGKSFSIEYNEQGEDVGVMDSSHHEERFAYMESERQIEKALEYAGEPSPRKEKRRLTKRHRIDHDTEEDLETDIMRATSSTTTLSHTALGAHREMLLVRIIKFIVYLLVGGFSNTWAYTGSRVHSVLSKLVICDAWLLASTSKLFRHKQCCWLLPLVLLLPLLLIGGICLHERGGLDHVYNYGVALKTDAKDSVQGYSNWLPSLSTGLMWLFGGAHRNNHTAVGADTSRSWWQFLSSPTTRTAKYDTTTIHEGDHITNMEKHTHIHQGLSVDEIQALIRATVQQELAAMSRDRDTSAKETELSQQAVNEDDLKAMIKSIVLPLIAKQSEDDRTFVLHNVEQQTHQHYIDLDVKYKENLEKSVVVEREHVMGVIDKAKKDLNTNINADLKQQIEQELKVELERLLGGELQERLKGDLQKKMSTGIGEELREELVKDVRGMLTAHETEVKNKLMILSAGLEEVKQREDVTRHDGTEEKKSEVDMNVLHIDEEKLKSDIQQAILLIMTERQANWQTELQSVHQEMYDKYSSDLKNKMQIQLDKQITDAFAGFVKDHEKQTEEQNTAANRAMLAAVTSSINAALQPAVDKTVAAAVTGAVQQTATQLIQQQLQTATREAVLLYMTQKEEQQMKEDGETQQSEAQEEGRLVGGAVGMTEEQVGSAIDAALLSYKSDLNDELLAALTKQQTEWQALWLTEQAEKEQQLVVKLGEENKAAVELLVSDWDQDKTTLQDQYAALVEKLNQQQTVIAGLSSGSSDVATSINDIQTAIAALSADTASVNASLIALAASSETIKTEDGSSIGDTIALGAHIDQAAIDALSASLQTLQNDVDELKRVTALYAGNIKECCRNDTALLMFIRTALAELLSGNDNPLGGMFVTPDQLDDRINQILLMLKTLQDQQQSSSGGAGGGFGGVGIGGGMSEQSVRALIKEALLVYGADRTGMVDHALESAGGSVISTRCSETYHRRTAELSLFGIPLWYTSNSPRTVIQPDMQPGQCWAFKGTQGYLVIELASRVHPTAFSLEHIPKSQSPTGRIDSAPRDFSVWGLSHPRDVDGAHLGNFTYDEQGEPLQFFHVKDIHNDAFSIIELRIHSNHGNVEYTCLYRFRVHGTLNS